MSTPTLGCWLDLPSPHIAEMIGQAGYGFTVIDLEHGPMSMETAMLCLMALAAHPILPIIRVTEGGEGAIKRALDAGAGGVMVPRVETAAQAEAMVQAFRYPPRGVRGAAQSVIRASAWGREADDYTDEVLQRHMLALQIESADGLAAIEDIAATDGVGMLFFGPADYAASIGVPMSDPAVMDAALTVARTARSHGLHAGMVVFPGADLAALADAGMSHISVASDVGVMVSGLSAARSQAEGLL